MARAVLEPVGEGEAELLDRGRAGLLHVVAGARDRVELRHVARGVLDDVGDDPQAGFGWVDVGVADHELLEDVVLQRARELVLWHALLLGRDDVAGHHRQDCAVHRQRHRDLVERDAAEEDLHVLDRVDRDPGLPDVADHAGVVAVVAPMRGEVERDREPLLAGRQVGAVERVRFLGGGETPVLPQGPRPVGVHRGVHAAHERLEAGERPDGFEVLDVLGGVERFDADAFRGVPDEGLRVLAPEFLRGELLPVGQRRVVTHAPKGTTHPRGAKPERFLLDGRFRYGVPAVRPRLRCISWLDGRFRYGVPAVRPRLRCIS